MITSTTKKTGCILSLTCRDTLVEPSRSDLRCILFRWHVGPHRGGDWVGPCWSNDHDV